MKEGESTKIFKDIQDNISKIKSITFQKLKNLFLPLCISFLLLLTPLISSNQNTITSPFALNKSSLQSISKEKNEHEVFGFAPYWNINKLDNINFNVLTTLAYFSVSVNGQGYLEKEDIGYQTFMGEKATEIFQKAHNHGTRVVLTLTQMDNYEISSLLDNPQAQKNVIKETTTLVNKRGLDGVNVDFEYVGDPEAEYRQKFTNFVNELTNKMHKEIPGSKVTVSVYAGSVKDPKLYDIAQLSQKSDGIFMMAYDFATSSSDNAVPTAPLYGAKDGKYWYDISSAVNDFLDVMKPDKLILGLPWYGYEYPVYEPSVNAQTYQGYYTYYWYGGYRYSSYYKPPAQVQTYANAQDNIQPVSTGWDDVGKVGWKAYVENGIWKMLFIDDQKSLKIKYDFAKEKNLAGVGVWALGMDDGKQELWNLLSNEFGIKFVDNEIVSKKINDII